MPAHQPYEDHELLLMLKANDELGLKYIYDKYWKRLYLSAFSIIRDAGPCEDIVQDVLLQLWLKRGEVIIHSLKSYLFTAVRYKVLSFIKSAGQRKVFIDTGELEQLGGIDELKDRLHERDINEMLDNGIASLPQRCKEVFMLSRKEYLSNREIAERMGISIKTVEAQMTIALRQLKINMSELLSGLILILYLIK
ncbi:RNA polymerase sigma-70 factor [Mucilaginibacter sp. X5P1]|uniref:RNA polymerase sigma-70 factor n=1 Tax=Mucilaginibacter sp. X5P1 TaxID=2723088 RepID=UPI00160A8662|nr:RNA polymerase sigma-70 factor [Mucilaginibacter sp. X5P1]MBB6141788.1 RNA polymerase sigma-70 factor (ECF subfamily) [Mucilaginibacter sp. X5P1]